MIRVHYRSRLGKSGQVEVARPEDARPVAERVVRSWCAHDRIVEVRLLDTSRIQARKGGKRVKF